MVSLAAARRWCDVTSPDYVPALLESGRARATADVSRSNLRRPTPNLFRSQTLLLMLSSPPSASCSRRTKRRRLQNWRAANWTPEGFIARSSRHSVKYLPPPTGAKSPALWGTRDALEDMLGNQASSIKAEPRMFKFRYRSPEHFLDVFKTFYGPVLKAIAALDPASQQDLHVCAHRAHEQVR